MASLICKRVWKRWGAIRVGLLLVGAVQASAQIGLPLSGPLFDCRPTWDFTAGGVVAHFSKGQLTGPEDGSRPPNFEVTPKCGQASLTILFSSYVKNVQLRVRASVGPAKILGAGSVNPGGAGKIVTVKGPTSFIDIWNDRSDGSVRVDMITFEISANPAANFDFIGSTSNRVLTHKYRSEDEYPSPLQTQDAKIRVEGIVYNLSGTAGVPGQTVYFRLLDPADTASYVVRAGDAAVNDNVDGPGALNGGATATAVSDADGSVAVELGVTSWAAGDNYQVEASFDANFSCAPSCKKSMVYTAWKRIYVETHKMFWRGTFIKAPVKPGDKVIVVDDVNGFPPPPYDLRLIHASPVESMTSDFYSETVRIVGSRTATGGGYELIMAGEVDPAAPGVQHSYASEERVLGVVRPYLRDAVGISTGVRAHDYILPNGKLISDAFEPAFVEHIWLTDSVPGIDDDLLFSQPRMPFDGVLPNRSTRIAAVDESETEWLTRKWLRNATRPTLLERSSAPNHQALFAATRFRLADKNGSTTKGRTTVADGFNDAWMFATETSMSNATFLGEAVVHEMAHQWLVNPATDAGGHCNTAFGNVKQYMWNHSALQCQMTSDLYGTAEASDGDVGFHYVKRPGQPPDSEYPRMRRRSEPVPQSEKTGRNPK